MAYIGSFIGFYVNNYIILVVFFRGMRGMVYIALNGSMSGFNRSRMDLFTKRFTKLIERIRGEIRITYWVYEVWVIIWKDFKSMRELMEWEF